MHEIFQGNHTYDYLLYSWQLRPVQILKLPGKEGIRNVNKMEPEFMPDPDAVKPDDWDDREWIMEPNFETCEEEMVRNPAYRGEWKPPQVKNPLYINDKLPNRSYSSDHVALYSKFIVEENFISSRWED